MKYLLAEMLDDVLEFMAHLLFRGFESVCGAIEYLLEKYVEELEDPETFKVVEKFVIFPKDLQGITRYLSKEKILKQLIIVKLKNGKSIKFWLSLDWVECAWSCKKCMIRAICDGKNTVPKEIGYPD